MPDRSIVARVWELPGKAGVAMGTAGEVTLAAVSPHLNRVMAVLPLLPVLTQTLAAFIPRLLELTHRIRQERAYQRQYQQIVKKRLEESSGQPLRTLMDDYTAKRGDYLGRTENDSGPIDGVGTEDGDDEDDREAPAPLKPVDDRSA